MLDRKVNLDEHPRPQVDAHDVAKLAASTPKSAVIALHDLRTGADAEVHRLESRVIGLTEEIERLRSENQKLTAANQKLNTELRESKLLLSKVQVDELRGLERVNSWLRR